MTTENAKNGDRAFDPVAIERAAQRAVHEALWRHRLLGETIVFGEAGRIVHLTGDEIPVTKPED